MNNIINSTHYFPLYILLLLTVQTCILICFSAAKLNKEIAAPCTNNQKKSPEIEKQNTADEDKEVAPLTAATQSATSEEDCKPPNSKEEEKTTETEEGKSVEDKSEDSKMEVDPCPETEASSQEKGKSNGLSIMSWFSLMLDSIKYISNLC